MTPHDMEKKRAVKNKFVLESGWVLDKRTIFNELFWAGLARGALTGSGLPPSYIVTQQTSVTLWSQYICKKGTKCYLDSPEPLANSETVIIIAVNAGTEELAFLSVRSIIQIIYVPAPGRFFVERDSS